MKFRMYQVLLAVSPFLYLPRRIWYRFIAVILYTCGKQDAALAFDMTALTMSKLTMNGKFATTPAIGLLIAHIRDHSPKEDRMYLDVVREDMFVNKSTFDRYFNMMHDTSAALQILDICYRQQEMGGYFYQSMLDRNNPAYQEINRKAVLLGGKPLDLSSLPEPM